MTTQSDVTIYGNRNAQAPEQLNLFSFIVGKWDGKGRTRLEDGTHAEFELTWIGRYVLDGMAIADEGHSLTPDGKPCLGISLRHFDTKRDSWIIEFLNVSGSFIRKQVNPDAGSVRQEGDTIVIVCGSGETVIRENYRVAGENKFIYSLDMSRDGGRSWDNGPIEMTMTRVD
jgi:hypothetical protein